MTKFTDDAYAVLKNIGGRKNIKRVRHCGTRLRFFLEDADLLNSKAIDALDNVTGSFIQGGQYQVVIGKEVPEFYKEFIEISGVADYYADHKEEGVLDKFKQVVKEYIFEK